MKSVAVIGAGPAGIAAAIEAARSGAKVALFEANETIGRKLLVTGSGRCNITNMNVRWEKYVCADPNFIQNVLQKVSADNLRNWLAGLGILTFSTPDGWCYPVSESAQAVVNLLASALQASGVEIHYSSRVSFIQKEELGFSFSVADRVHHADRMIICAGGKALPGLGSKGDLFPLLNKLGHKVEPLLPALAPILADMKLYQKLQGIRLDIQAGLFQDKALLTQTRGNLIFTSWGMNGPAVMDLSHLISKHPKDSLKIELNLLLDHEKEFESLFALLKTARVSAVLGSILPPKLSAFLMNRNGLSDSLICKDVKKDQKEKLFGDLTRLTFSVQGVRGFEFCQLKTGGVPVTEIDSRSMESHFVPGLYLAGETMDVAGPCGGYNLHFAFASGLIAGSNAACN